jgi:hypothetical protein
MSVQAKFYVERVEHVHTGQPNQVCANVTMKPVYGDSPENKTWSKYTPNGKLEMTVTNPGAIDQLEVGRAYFLTFDPVD